MLVTSEDDKNTDDDIIMLYTDALYRSFSSLLYQIELTIICSQYDVWSLIFTLLAISKRIWF